MKAKYPLEQVLAVKHDRVEKAERLVEEKKRALQIEMDKLKKVEEEHNKVKTHHDDKLTQLRFALDTGTTSDEVLQMKAYLKVVKEKLAKEEVKLKAQQEQVRIAERNLNEAKLDLKKKRLEEEKIALHKEHWLKEARKEEDQKEALEQDEIGQLLYEAEKRKRE